MILRQIEFLMKRGYVPIGHVPCLACNGTGTVELDAMCYSGFRTTRSYTCKECNGGGFVPATNELIATLHAKMDDDLRDDINLINSRAKAEASKCTELCRILKSQLEDSNCKYKEVSDARKKMEGSSD
jgi:RecJ-like exonuclease